MDLKGSKHRVIHKKLSTYPHINNYTKVLIFIQFCEF